MKGKTQSYARQLNNKLIMHELRKGECSATMLANRLGLSNAALSDILSNLLQCGYIRQTDTASAGSIGRKPVYYAINGSFGYVAVVSLAEHCANIVVSDMNMKVTDNIQTSVKQYDVTTLYELLLTVSRVLSQEKYRIGKLLGVELSVTGKINKQTGELLLSPSIDKSILSPQGGIVGMFARQFNVPVNVTNYISLAALGEMYDGAMRNVSNGMLVHVDEGIGGAFVFDGKLYEGEQGCGGEIGLMRTVFNGEYKCLNEVASLRAISNVLGLSSVNELTSAYKRSPSVRGYVNSTAVSLSRVLKDLAELLDISKITLSGRVKEFGTDYLSVVQNEVDKSQNACAVEYSVLTNPSVAGAVRRSVTEYTDKLFD